MGLLRMDAFHFALLVAIVLLAVYVARGYGLFREGVNAYTGNIALGLCMSRCQEAGVGGGRGDLRGWGGLGLSVNGVGPNEVGRDVSKKPVTNLRNQ